MDKYLIMIGGGEIRAKETLEIDRQIAELAKAHAGENRAVALFIGTASHDLLPYYNSFHKTYTGEFGLKTDVIQTVFKHTEEEKMNDKFAKADMIYVGAGDTLFMLDNWKENGILERIKDAYERGVVICGLSAGAICWAENMYTDSSRNGDEKYRLEQGLGWVKGGVCPHYDLRREDFKEALKEGCEWLCIENNSAVVYKNGEFSGTLSCGGKSYRVSKQNGEVTESEI